MSSLSIYFFFLLCSMTCIKSSNILAIFPYPFKERYIVVEPLLKALAARGHKMVVVSHFPQTKRLPNFYDIVIDNRDFSDVLHLDESQIKNDALVYKRFLRNVTISVLENKNLQLLSYNRNFHLVLTEIMSAEAIYGYAPYYNAHLVGIAPKGTNANIDRMVCNESPSSYIPMDESIYGETSTSFLQRFYNLWAFLIDSFSFVYDYETEQHVVFRTYFRDLPMQLTHTKKNFSLILLNQHFTLSIPRPYVPRLVEVGGMHLTMKRTRLPNDIREFIKSSKDGVIYFAMGAQKNKIERPQLIAMFNAFKNIKEFILFKHDNPLEPIQPLNVLIKPWFNQTDILILSRIKLFISHCGYTSLMETVYYGKPVICLPITEDQFINTERMHKMGIGESIPYYELTALNFWTTLNHVLTHIDNYTEAVQIISKRFQDQPQHPLDKATFWIEYILFNRGAKFMRSRGMDVNFLQYYCLDVIAYSIVTGYTLYHTLYKYMGTFIKRILYILIFGPIINFLRRTKKAIIDWHHKDMRTKIIRHDTPRASSTAIFPFFDNLLGVRRER